MGKGIIGMDAVQRADNIRNAFRIGIMCLLSYLSVDVARNILGAVSPQMMEQSVATTEQIGSLSSFYFITYAVGQLINGGIGNRVKAKFMICGGLAAAGICLLLIPSLADTFSAVYIAYGMMGFFLSMIYGPMTRVVAENTVPAYTTRCTLGYTVSFFLGSPVGGLLAAIMSWQNVFVTGSILLFVMGGVCYVAFQRLEGRHIIRYDHQPVGKKSNGLKPLLKRGILLFAFISMLTGIMRTSVVFWMPTYLSQQLGFSPQRTALFFTIATFVMAANSFAAIFLYEWLFHRNMEQAMLVFFLVSALLFALMYQIKNPVLNAVFFILAVTASCCAATMLYSIYCPSLRDTGSVSFAAGFVDFASYVAAALSSMLFANAVSVIGWDGLIWIWFGLMVAGAVLILLYMLGMVRKDSLHSGQQGSAL